MLEFKKRMQEKIQFKNLSSMFGVSAIPQDSQLRDVLDAVPSYKLTEIFEDYFRLLQRGKHLETYQFMPGKYLAKKEFWNQLRCTFRIFFFTSWECLLQFIISPIVDRS